MPNTNANDADARRSDDESPSHGFDYVTIENDDTPNECAIFPRNATEGELMTNWIAAHEGSFVGLESMR